MRGSVAAAFVLMFAGMALATVLWAVREVNKASKRAEALEQLRADVAKLEADVARLEGENVKLNSEREYLRALASGRKDIEDLTAEIRTMVWVLAGPNSGRGIREGERGGHTQPDPTGSPTAPGG